LRKKGSKSQQAQDAQSDAQSLAQEPAMCNPCATHVQPMCNGHIFIALSASPCDANPAPAIFRNSIDVILNKAVVLVWLLFVYFVFGFLIWGCICSNSKLGSPLRTH